MGCCEKASCAVMSAALPAKLKKHRKRPMDSSIIVHNKRECQHQIVFFPKCRKKEAVQRSKGSLCVNDVVFERSSCSVLHLGHLRPRHSQHEAGQRPANGPVNQGCLRTLRTFSATSHPAVYHLARATLGAHKGQNKGQTDFGKNRPELFQSKNLFFTRLTPQKQKKNLRTKVRRLVREAGVEPARP